MYSYDRHIGYANGCLCFPCVYELAKYSAVFTSVYVRVHVYVYERLSCDRVYSVLDANVSGLTNKAVNISSSLSTDLVNVRDSVVRSHHLKLIGLYAHCTHWKFSVIII